jgi:predicted phosphodiesterase
MSKIQRKDTIIIDYRKGMTDAQIKKAAGFDDSYVITQATMLPKGGKMRVVAVKSNLLSDEKVEDLIGEIKKIKPLKASKGIKVDATKESVMATINMFDFHLGRLADKDNVYGHSYDTNIGCKVFEDAFDAEVERLKKLPYHYEQVVINYGGDFFNADNEDNLTTSLKHAVDCDTRYPDYFTKGLQLMNYGIQKALEITNNVYVANVPGNHDHNSFQSAISALWVMYSKDERVTVQKSTNNRSVVNYGNNLIIMTHGVEGKRRQYLPFVEEQAKEFVGKYKNIEVISGHTHTHQLITTDNDITLEVCAQSAPVADAWTANNGWAEAKGDIYTMIYDKNSRIGQFILKTGKFLPKPKKRKKERWEIL